MDVNVVVGFLERDETKKQNRARNEWRKQRADRVGCPKEKQNLRNDKQADPILSLPLSAESLLGCRPKVGAMGMDSQ